MSEEETTKPVEKRPIPRLSEEEINTLAKDLVKNDVFVASQAPPEILTSVFMVIGLGGLSNLEDPEDIGNIYEYYDKAGPRSINGFPMFTSCRIVNKADWAKVTEKAIKIDEAMNEAMK